MTLAISNYKITVYTKEPLQRAESIIVKKTDYGLPGFGKEWHFGVYDHVTLPSFVNVTGIRCLQVELPIVKFIIATRFNAEWNHVKVNQVFCSRKQNQSYCLGSMKRLGEQLYGKYFIFFYEPEFGSVLQMSSRQKPNITLMLYGTASVCCFVPDHCYIAFCEHVLKELYVEDNLKEKLSQSE